LFTYPRFGRILAGGAIDPATTEPQQRFHARGFSGSINTFGTLDVIDTLDSSIFTFTFPWEHDPIR
jgi:hypothetical protein